MTPTERRDAVPERRRQATPALSRYSLLGRRRSVRRAADVRANYYVDRPAEQALLSVAILLLLSVLDAMLSLQLFSLGTYYEFNPLLALLLELGVGAFLVGKLALTIPATAILLLHWNFVLAGRFKLAKVTRLLVSIYVGLIAYEILLLMHG